MKALNNVLIGIAVISMVLGIVSRLSIKPISGIESRAMYGFAATVLLLVIAMALTKEKA